MMADQATTRQDNEAITNEVTATIAQLLNPDQVFETDELEAWALANGFVKESELEEAQERISELENELSDMESHINELQNSDGG